MKLYMIEAPDNFLEHGSNHFKAVDVRKARELVMITQELDWNTVAEMYIPKEPIAQEPSERSPSGA